MIFTEEAVGSMESELDGRKQVAPLTEFQSKFIEKLGLPDPVIYLEHIKLE